MELDDDIDREFLLGDGTEELVPPDIIDTDPVFDIAYHPKMHFLAAGLVTGEVHIHEYKKTETAYVGSYKLHEGGISSLEFTEDGQHLVTVSSDRSISIFDCNAQQTTLRVPKGKGNPHKEGISTVNICSDNIIATGDDDGKIVMWDVRQGGKPVQKYHEHADYVTQILFFSEVNQVLSSSGDTCLGCYDMRVKQIVDFSAPRPDELHCLAFIPATNDIICGTDSGLLPMWKYGSWKRPYDAFQEHPKEVDCITTFNDNIVFTGAYDGVVRVLQVYPVRRVLTHIGGNQRRSGVNKIRISPDRNVIAMSFTDRHIQFADIDFMSNDETLDMLRSKAEQRYMRTLRDMDAEREAQKKKMEAAEDSEDGDWSTDSEEGEEDDSDDDDSDDDGDEEGGGSKRKKKAKGDGKANADDGNGEVKELSRQEKRERVAAAKWLKSAKKEKVNFRQERKKRRVGGFWSDL